MVALLDAGDRHHDACARLLAEYPGPLVVPVLCVAEVAYFARQHGGAEAELRFLGTLSAGRPAVNPLHPADFERIAQLVARYRNLPLGTTDASVVAAAERLGVTTIATLDRRDFTAVNPRHVEAFELLP